MTVTPVYVFDLAAQHARWATVRQAVLTGNIANANTAGYTAKDIAPFSAVLDSAATGSVAMAETNPRHISTTGDSSGGERVWEATDTGKPVALDNELMRADETSRAFSLDTSVVRAFQRMLLASVRSGG